MNKAMEKFMFYVRKKDKTLYCAETLNNIFAGIQRYIRGVWNDRIPVQDISFYNDVQFKGTRMVLDGMMKRAERDTPVEEKPEAISATEEMMILTAIKPCTPKFCVP
jgi:hypothetical protein